ncbi:MAG: hypothetical protein KAW92_09445 [Candidatus Cloacimonetes bacterium]|nr:hypothetical protein [Candidatus Cloacimonadota bacterium]
MEMLKLSKKLRKLEKGTHLIVYKSLNEVKVTVTQTGKYSDNDYAVGLILNDEEEFYPSHIRLMIDLYIKRESNLEESKKLFFALEQVYNGKDPNDYKRELRKINFPMKLDEAEVNLYLAQLLMIEQDFNFGPGAPKKSKLDPPREYLMRFLRWIAAGDTQIDRIIFAAAGRKYPAPEKYASPIKK